jgi:hypothetical protein
MAIDNPEELIDRPEELVPVAELVGCSATHWHEWDFTSGLRWPLTLLSLAPFGPAALMTEDYFRQGNRAAFDRVLAKVPSAPPDPWDRREAE